MEDHHRVGTRFAGRYDILEQIGTGGMGAVYRARHAFTARELALKIIRPELAQTPTAQERFLREAQVPNRVGHPAMVEVFDAGFEGRTPYIAMELLHGRSFAEAIERRSLATDETVGIVAELLEGLEAAHAQGVIHRDIKPENVFLATHPTRAVRLLDFGIVRMVDDTSKLTGPGVVLGTPYYMSPEQAGAQALDRRADIWSCGAVLHHALVGEPPFQATSYGLLVMAILQQPAPRLNAVRPDLPLGLADVVARALEKDPAQRFQSAAEFRRALLTAHPAAVYFGTGAAATFANSPKVEPIAPTSVSPPALNPPAPAYPPEPRVPTPAPTALAPAPPRSSTRWLLIALLGAVPILFVMGVALAWFIGRPTETASGSDVVTVPVLSNVPDASPDAIAPMEPVAAVEPVAAMEPNPPAADTETPAEPDAPEPREEDHEARGPGQTAERMEGPRDGPSLGPGMGGSTIRETGPRPGAPGMRRTPAEFDQITAMAGCAARCARAQERCLRESPSRQLACVREGVQCFQQCR
ncbi:MAG: protein kinase [Myxococcota bacterium]